MQPINPTILHTPLGIHQAVQATFGISNIRLKLIDQKIALYIRFSERLPEMRLTNAVDAKQFQETLDKVKTYLERIQLFNTPIPQIALDPSKFSFQEPLSNWQEYRQFIHHSTGHNCTETLITFLQNPALVDEVNQIGLGPNQINGRGTANDLVYFRGVMEKLSKETLEMRQVVITNFERHYPYIFQQLIRERIAKETTVQEQDNFYQQNLKLLKQHVIGQDQAAAKVAAILASQRNSESNKVFLFVGPSGVGKTELAKAISKTRQDRFITVEMQTCQDEHTSAKIFGPPPGYVGSEDKANFAHELDKHNPELISTKGSTTDYKISNLVILFDEFEKAHSRIKQSLLTLFDEGLFVTQYSKVKVKDNITIRDNLTCRYFLKKCIIVNTSNLYKNAILQAFSADYSFDQIIDLFKQLNFNEPTPESLSTELLGRMSVIPFGPIPQGHPYQSIVRMKLNDFCAELKKDFECRLVDIEQEASVLSAIETKLYGDGTDIRRFRRYFDDIKSIIYQNFHTWGPMANKRLTFCCVQEVLCIKVSAYLEDFLRYCDLEIPPLLIP